VPDHTADSQNFEVMLSPHVDHLIDSMEIVNNKAEKSCSSIAEARKVDETIRKVWHALCVCELPSAEVTGQESRLMEMRRRPGCSSTLRVDHKCRCQTEPHFLGVRKRGDKQCFDQQHPKYCMSFSSLKPLQRPHRSS
jgi:hypothetical protein